MFSFYFTFAMIKLCQKADVAELVDALDLGSSKLTLWEFESLRPHNFNYYATPAFHFCSVSFIEPSSWTVSLTDWKPWLEVDSTIEL